MILSGFIILSATGTVNPREPLQLFDSHASAVRVAKSTRPKGTYVIKPARAFFATSYGSAMLALIRARMDAHSEHVKEKGRRFGLIFGMNAAKFEETIRTDQNIKLQNGADPNSKTYIHKTIISSVEAASPVLSKLDKMRADLKREKAERQFAVTMQGVDAKAARDKIAGASLPFGCRSMPETIARVNSERASLASPTVLPSVVPKEKIEWELDRLMCRFNANSLCTQQDIDTRAKSRKEVAFALERLNKFAKRDAKATPMDVCLRKVDLLILFRAGKLPENLKHIAKITNLTMP